MEQREQGELDMDDIKVGDLVQAVAVDEQHWVGRVVTVSDAASVQMPDGSVHASSLPVPMAYVEITKGAGAGKPYGFDYRPVEALELVHGTEG